MINYSFTYGDLEYFLLIIVRISCFIFVAPFFAIKGIPNSVKVGISIFISILLYGIVQRDALEYNTVLGYSIIVMKEAVVGLILGFAAAICNSIASFAGHIADMQTGLSMATLMDPNTNESVTITGTLYQQVILAMLIVSGMYRYIIRAIVDSYSLIPVNGAVFHSDRLISAMTGFMRDFFVIGFRICLPVFIVTFVLNMVLGILAKVSPQLNMFAVGIQIKIIVGLAIMFLTCNMLGSAADFIFQNMEKMMQLFADGMSA